MQHLIGKEIVNFIADTIYDHESYFYNVAYDKADSPVFNKSKLSDENFMDKLILLTTINYINDTYRSLILQDDEYIMDYFNRMCINNHTTLCLLDFLFRAILITHTNFDRSEMDISTHESYMKIVNKQIDENIDDTILIDMLDDHECTILDISTCDPEVEFITY